MTLFFAGQPQEAEKVVPPRRPAESPVAVRAADRGPRAAGAAADRRRPDRLRESGCLAPQLPSSIRSWGRLPAPGHAPQGRRGVQIALTLDPGSADSHTGLGLALQSQGRYADAEAEHNRPSRWTPTTPPRTTTWPPCTLTGDDSTKPGNAGTGRSDRPAARHPLRPPGRNRLYRQDLFAAQEYARRAVSLLPDSALTHYELGRVYLEQERTTQAEQEFREATTLDRHSPQPATRWD